VSCIGDLGVDIALLLCLASGKAGCLVGQMSEAKSSMSLVTKGDPGGGGKPWGEDISLHKHLARNKRIPEHTEAGHCSSKEERLVVEIL